MRLAAIILILAFAACGNIQPGESHASENKALCEVLPGETDTISPTKSGVQYLPPSIGKPVHVCNFKGYPECFPEVSAFKNEWYSEYWEAAGEPSLYEISKGQDSAQGGILRFTWLPTFHHPVTVRFEIAPGSTTMIAKELSGAGGYEPGSINRQITRTLNSEEARQLAEAMAKASPFNEPPARCVLGTDGSQWMLERAETGIYDYVSRWTPQEGAMHDFGMLALTLTGWKFEEIY